MRYFEKVQTGHFIELDNLLEMSSSQGPKDSGKETMGGHVIMVFSCYTMRARSLVQVADNTMEKSSGRIIGDLGNPEKGMIHCACGARVSMVQTMRIFLVDLSRFAQARA
jgi:hypothetical protein